MNWVSIVLIIGLISSLDARPEHMQFGEKLLSTEEIRLSPSPNEGSHKHLSARVEIEMPSNGLQKRLLSPIPVATQKIDSESVSKDFDSFEKSMLLVSTSPASSPNFSTTSTLSTTTQTSTPTSQTIRKNDTINISETPKARYYTANYTQNSQNLTKNNNNSSRRINTNNKINALVNGKSNQNTATSRQLFPIISLPPDSLDPSQPIFNTPNLVQSTNPNGLHRQYLYSVNTIVGTTSPDVSWHIPTSPPQIMPQQLRPTSTHTIIEHPAQTSLFLSPQQIYTSNLIQTHTEASIPSPQIINVANVESTFHSMPNNGRPQHQQYITQHRPSLFHDSLRTNVTHLYSIITSTTATPDPYRNYQKVQTSPTVHRRKVLRLRVTTATPPSSTAFPKFTVTIVKKDKPMDLTKSPNKNDDKNKNNKKTNQNHADNKNQEVKKDNKNTGNNNKKKKPENESSTKKPEQQNNNKINGKKKNEKNVTEVASINNKLRLAQCKITANDSDFRNENVCGAGDLKIIIKFDGDSLNDTTESLKQASIKNTTQTKGVSATSNKGSTDVKQAEGDDLDYQYYDDADYPDEVGQLRGPQANKRRRQRIRRRRQRNRNRRKRYRNRRKRTRVRQRRRKSRRKKNKDKKGEGGGDYGSGSSENVYQTIVLQPNKTHPSSPTTQLVPVHRHPVLTEPTSEKHEWFMKFLSYVPLIALLKPISFGFWTIALSPVLVIGAATLALGVALYPWFTLSKEHAIHTAIKRPPTVVIHKHPRSSAGPPAVPITVRYAKPTYSRPTFSHRRKINVESIRTDDEQPQNTNYPFIRRHKRQANLFTTKYTYRDINFRHWLLIKNNFEIRHLKWTESDDDDEYNF